MKPRLTRPDAVLLLHGQGDNRAGMLGYASLFLSKGYTVLLPDARGHGESGGELATYGIRESGDIRGWYEWLKRTQSPQCIFGLGESMGAADLLVALQSEPGFCAVIAESPFSSLQEAAIDRSSELLDAGPWLGKTLLRPAVASAFIYARFRYDLSWRHISPAAAVKATSVPVLLIHGLSDHNLPPANSEEIMQECGGKRPHLKLWLPSRAGHCGAYAAHPRTFSRQVLGWFEKYREMSPAGPPKGEAAALRRWPG